MEKLQIFENVEFGKIRTIEENGKILFCGSDVAKDFRVCKCSRFLKKKHCKSDGIAKYDSVDNLGRKEYFIVYI